MLFSRASYVRLAGAASVLPLLLQLAHATAQLTAAQGLVRIDGETPAELPKDLYSGDTLETGTRAKAVLTFEDGSTVELGADSRMFIEETTSRRKSLRLTVGLLRAQVTEVPSRKFEVRTPTSVCSVRGTEFQIRVLSGGRTLVDLVRGLLGVEDNRGHAILLRPDESLAIDGRGMGVPRRTPSAGETRKADAGRRMRREVRLDMDKQEVLEAAARESKLAEFQQGRILLDIGGERVRLEKYILRPNPNEFKLVVLNLRKSRFDYFYYKGTFNRTLPTDLSLALRDLSGGLDVQPSYFLTAFETGRSNLTDSILELAQGGHLVDLNSNADPGDDAASFFDASKDAYVDASGRGVFQTLYDRYGFYLNGKLKYGWTGTNLQAYSDKTESSITDPISGAALTSANAYLEGSGQLVSGGAPVGATFPDDAKLHQRVYQSYSDGSFLSWDNYAVDGAGEPASLSDFAGARNGAPFRLKLLEFNYEQVITATEFQGRKIDLLIEPKVLIQSGLLQ